MAFEPFNWTCEYCGTHTTIEASNISDITTPIDTKKSKYGSIGLHHVAVACPNAECNELTLSISIYNGDYNGYNGRWRSIGDEAVVVFNLLPRSLAKPQPKFIPKEIRDNYLEACLISKDSPKASAAMSRRCLQGIIRDFWEIPKNKRGNLGAEISYVKDNIDADTWDAINTVRSVGDIGAHMEKDVNLIIDVEPDEAQLLIQLIETLLEDWYVERFKRQERNAKLKKLGEEKLQQKKAAKNQSNDQSSQSSSH